MTVAEQVTDSGGPAETAASGQERHIGVVTRAISWGLDAVVINLVATLVGVGVALVISIFPVAKNLQTMFEGIAGGVYLLWTALYFVVFWSTTGQTPGARVMQIRQLTARKTRVHPIRALVRWVGMNLAIVTLGAGYIPLLFGRRPFPDWLAKTLVLDVDARQLSLAQVARRARRERSGRSAAVTAPEPGSSSPETNPR
jgi:uncharacterized RDD family membrane protein YckC